MLKNCAVKFAGNAVEVQVGRRLRHEYTIHQYVLSNLTASSAKRLAGLVSGYRTEKTVKLDSVDLTPTVYFSYGQHAVEQIKVGKSLLYPDHEEA